MRNRQDELSESFLAAEDPGGTWEHSVLLIIAGRMQGETLRYQLVSLGFDVDVARAVSMGMLRVSGGSYDALILDWQTLEVEYIGAARNEAWERLVAQAKRAGVGIVTLLDSEQSIPLDIEQPGVVTITRAAAAEPLALAEAVARSSERQSSATVDIEKHAPSSVIEDFLFGGSEAIRRVFEQVRLVASRDTTVLITGETGTGKERVSRAIHRLSSRGSLEMVTVNCGGIPATLLEDEFFGHVKGAFTDARQMRIGRFEQANRSTIFLDEIGDLPLELQPKLLRVLQEREIHRIGGVEAVQLDVRVIAATNIDLWKRVEEGRFREDLFYRINVYHIHLPPLRERAEDIPLFIRHFLEKLCRRDGLPCKRLKASAEAELMSRPWRGNIRELENAVEIAVIRSQDRTELTEHDFPQTREMVAQPTPISRPGDSRLDFKTLVTRYERELILRTLDQTQGNKNRAAQMLRMKRTTLIEKLKRFES
jgi:transcriptional regulator with GAF, ATPase, and Fis domain